MFSHHEHIFAMERRPAPQIADGASLALLQSVIDGSGAALIHGPVVLPGGITLSAERPLIVPPDRELVVVVGGRLREVVPPGVYSSAPWLFGAPCSVHVVDMRERRLEIASQGQIRLRYPHNAHEDLLLPHDLRIVINYRVVAPERTALNHAHPLLLLHDTTLDLLLTMVDGTSVEELGAALQRLPDELRLRELPQRSGLRPVSVALIGRPVAQADEASVVSDPILALLHEDIRKLRERPSPIYTHVTRDAAGHQIYVPLWDDQQNQLELLIRCAPGYPEQPPSLEVRYNKQVQRYRSELLERWSARYGLVDLIDAVIEGFPKHNEGAS